MAAARRWVALVLCTRCLEGSKPRGGRFCKLPDAASKGQANPRAASQKSHRLDVFVSGVEGTGHHGVVGGFLAPLVSTAAGEWRNGNMACVEAREIPFYAPPNMMRRKCTLYSFLGWESYPSDRRLGVKDRLALLFRGPGDCFLQDRLASSEPGFVPQFPNNWNSANPRGADGGCWRCGSSPASKTRRERERESVHVRGEGETI